MEVSTIISWIPKIAATLLVILGVLIVLEIRRMIRIKKSAPTPINAANRDIPQITKVHFPDTAVHTESLVTQTRKFNKLFLMIIPIIVIVFFVVIHFLVPSTTDTITNQLSSNPQITSVPLEIKVYRFGDAGDLELINQSELKKLEPGMEIIIAVKPYENSEHITFTVNETAFDADLTNKTPNGEVYIKYTIKPDVTDYRIGVTVQ